MSTHKIIDKLCVAAIILSLLLTVIFMNGSALGVSAVSRTFGYETRLFDAGYVHTIDIVMDDWNSFIETCENEEYTVCAVVIDGEAYKNVGIRAKGNTSLSTVSSMNSDRYSFKIEFDHYDSTKNYYGLDKLCLNNLIQDNTFMKDYLVYQMMNNFGVNASLCSYAYITVNGEDWGLYLAVEGVEESFLQRNYGNDYGELYKPDSTSMGGGRGNGRNFDIENFIDPSGDKNVNSEMPRSQDNSFNSLPGNFSIDDNFSPSSIFGSETDPVNGIDKNMGNTNMMNMGNMSSSDVKLQYIDDDPSSYSSIFENAKTDISDADEARLIDSLKSLGNLENIENVVDIDEVMRYFVVHNFVVNEDSYTGSMIHNYYLYEKDGQLSMIPWDYNLAFGGFQAADANKVVNDPIDTPLSVGSTDSRPMIDWIFASDEYTDMYHSYFTEFIESMDINAMIEETTVLIAPYVQKDPTKFCTYEEFETGVNTIKAFCTLRIESVEGQLAGIIPSTSAGQSADSSMLIDASNITISDMGSMNSNRGMSDKEIGNFNIGTGEAFPNMQDGKNDNILPSEPSDMGQAMPGQQPNNFPQSSENMNTPPDADSQMPGNMGDDFFPGNFSDNTGNLSSDSSGNNSLVLFTVTVIILLAGLIFAFEFKR